MPFALPTFFSGNVQPSTADTTDQPKLYFPPGGRTHDRHAIPPDRLQISLSDPVLLAAEEYLAHFSDDHRWIKNDGARRSPRSPVYRPKEAVLQGLGADNASSPTVPTDTQAATQEAHDPLDDLDEVSEVVVVPDEIDGSPGCTDDLASQNSQYGNLAPLASEMFKQELYIRGYLKRPASRPPSIAPRKSRICFTFDYRNLFPNMLWRRQGRKATEQQQVKRDTADVHPPKQPSTPVGCAPLRTPQAGGLGSPWLGINMYEAEIPSGLDTPLSEEQSIACPTLGTPQTGSLESPSVATPTSPSGSYDLHEFSYLTAFTTPPPSPAIAETCKSGADLDDSQHAV